MKLKIIALKGLNEKLNNVYSPITTFSFHSILIYRSLEESNVTGFSLTLNPIFIVKFTHMYIYTTQSFSNIESNLLET